MSSWVTDMVLDSVPCAVDNVIVPVRVHFFCTRWNIRSLNRSYHLLSLLLRQNEATAELYIDRYCNYSHWALIYPPMIYNVANINNWTKYNNIFSYVFSYDCILITWHHTYQNPDDLLTKVRQNLRNHQKCETVKNKKWANERERSKKKLDVCIKMVYNEYTVWRLELCAK